jgi:hypothetical protein
MRQGKRGEWKAGPCPCGQDSGSHLPGEDAPVSPSILVSDPLEEIGEIVAMVKANALTMSCSAKSQGCGMVGGREGSSPSQAPQGTKAVRLRSHWPPRAFLSSWQFLSILSHTQPPAMSGHWPLKCVYYD